MLRSWIKLFPLKTKLTEAGLFYTYIGVLVIGVIGGSTALELFNKKLSCGCDSRSYCVRRTVYWQTYQTGLGYKFIGTGSTHDPIPSTGRVYERTRILSCP